MPRMYRKLALQHIIFCLFTVQRAYGSENKYENSFENVKDRSNQHENGVTVPKANTGTEVVNFDKGSQFNGLNNSPNSTLHTMIINNTYQYYQYLALMNPENIISSPVITYWGNWGTWDNCSSGQYAIGFQLKSEEKRIMKGTKDNTALNGISLLCGKPDSQDSQDVLSYPTSSVGSFGKWGDYFYCNGLLTGFQLRSEEDQGDGDNTAANNLRGICTKTAGAPEVIEGDGDTWGDWTAEQRCDNGNAVCAIQTQVDLQSAGDYLKKKKGSVHQIQ